MYRRIVDALAADITNGRLLRGQQLATHRALASALGIDLTTVARACTKAHSGGLRLTLTWRTPR
jgi:DNA-binding transcriptional regulator YhcF (GntR family)